MTPEQYALARRLALADPNPARWDGCIAECQTPGKRRHHMRIDARLYPARDAIADGYAPDITHPWALGVMLTWAMEEGPPPFEPAEFGPNLAETLLEVLEGHP